MVDKWGRPEMNDWMWMTQSVMGIQRSLSRLKGDEINQQSSQMDLDKKVEAEEYDSLVEKHTWNLHLNPSYVPPEYKLGNSDIPEGATEDGTQMDMGSVDTDGNPTKKPFNEKAWWDAQLRVSKFNTAKKAGDVAEASATRKKIEETLNSQLPVYTQAIENNDPVAANRMYTKILGNWDDVKTDTDIVEGSINYTTGEMKIRNNFTGKVFKTNIPTKEETFGLLNKFYNVMPDGTGVVSTNEKTENMLTYLTGNVTLIREHNRKLTTDAMADSKNLYSDPMGKHTFALIENYVNFKASGQTELVPALIDVNTGKTILGANEVDQTMKEGLTQIGVKGAVAKLKDESTLRSLNIQRSREGIASDRVVTKGREIELQDKYVKQFDNEATRAINSILPTGISYKDGAIVKNIGGKDMAISEGDLTNSQVKQVREVIQESNYFASLIREGKSVKEAKKAVADARKEAKKARAKVKSEPGAVAKETVVEQSEFEKEVAKKVGKAQPPVPVGGGVLDMSSVTPKGAMDAEKMRMNLSEAATEEKKKRGWIK